MATIKTKCKNNVTGENTNNKSCTNMLNFAAYKNKTKNK